MRYLNVILNINYNTINYSYIRNNVIYKYIMLFKNIIDKLKHYCIIQFINVYMNIKNTIILCHLYIYI